MKRLLCLAVSLLMILLFAVIAQGSYVYENEGKNFTITLPDDFDEVEEMKFIGDDGSNFGVTIKEYTEEDKDYCIMDMTEEELKERADVIADVSRLAFATVQREGSIEVVSVEKIEHKNGLNAVVMEFKTTAKTETGETVRYQKIYEFTCAKNIYSFTYTSNEGGGPDDMDEAFDSITVNEAENEGIKGTVKVAVGLLIVVGLIVIGIVRFMRTPEKRRQGKLK